MEANRERKSPAARPGETEFRHGASHAGKWARVPHSPRPIDISTMVIPRQGGRLAQMEVPPPLQLFPGPPESALFSTKEGFGCCWVNYGYQARADAFPARHGRVQLGFEPRGLAQNGQGMTAAVNATRKRWAVWYPDAPDNVWESPADADDQPLEVAAGPDGCFWFTDLVHNRIGCLNPFTRTVTRFELPCRNGRPAKIVAGPQGKMVFTLLGATRLGAIQAVEPVRPAAANPGGAAAWEVPVLARRVQEPLRRKRPRHPWLVAPEEPAAAAAEEKSPEPAPDAVAAPQQPLAEAAPADRETRRRQATRAALVDLGVERVAWDHICREHRYEAPNRKGQFLRRRSNLDALERMVLATLEAPDQDPRLDVDGRWIYDLTFPQAIGLTPRGVADWAMTRSLRVMLESDGKTVMTAYPVPGP